MEAYEVLTDPMRRTEYESASFSAVMRSATSEIHTPALPADIAVRVDGHFLCFFREFDVQIRQEIC